MRKAPRMKWVLVLPAFVLAAMLPLVASGYRQRPQPDQKSVRIQLLSLLDDREPLYMLTGGGGNSLVLVRDEGVVLIDSKLPGWSQALLDKVALVTDRPVTMIINTHAHVDHTGGNRELPTVTDIIAHERTRATMRKMDEFKGPNAKFLPNKTVIERMSLFEEQVRIDLYYFGAGHTDGDLVAVLPEHGIAYMGDLFPSKATPVIDQPNGGSGVAFPETLARAVREISRVTRVVTGHDPGPAPGMPRRPLGDIQSWSDLQEYVDFNRDFLDAVRTAFKQGKRADEAAANLPLPGKYATYDMQQARANVEIIYKELSK